MAARTQFRQKPSRMSMATFVLVLVLTVSHASSHDVATTTRATMSNWWSSWQSEGPWKTGLWTERFQSSTTHFFRAGSNGNKSLRQKQQQFQMDETDSLHETEHNYIRKDQRELAGYFGLATHAVDRTWSLISNKTNFRARHECAFVQAGDKFYLFGGREWPRIVNRYDYTTDTWVDDSTGAIVRRMSHKFNHFQAVTYEGLIWVIGAFFTQSFPNERNAGRVQVFDPANNVWMPGPSIPNARRRGGGGLVVYKDKFYLLGGNNMGHNGGYVAFMDEYDPATGAFVQLPDAPHARDHFQAVVVNDGCYAIGGRLSGGEGGTFAPLVEEVDVYNFTTGSWTTLPQECNIPTPRAAGAVSYFDNEIIVAGGENTVEALSIVESFNPVSRQWTRRADMGFRRHGTQAIVSGDGLFIVAGSNRKGGGRQHNLEVYGTNKPQGEPSAAGGIKGYGTSTMQREDEVEISDTFTEFVAVEHTGEGNQGVFVRSVALTGRHSTLFQILTDVSQPFLIGIGKKRLVEIAYLGGATDAVVAEASLRIRHSNNQDLNVPLLGISRVAFANAGSRNPVEDDPALVRTNSRTFPSTSLTIMVPPPEVFTRPVAWMESHRSGRNAALTYSFPIAGLVAGVDDDANFRVDIGFAEVWRGGCSNGRRRFGVTVQGRVMEPDLDVYRRVGCSTALLLSYRNIAPAFASDPAQDATITIEFTKGRANSPMVNYIEIFRVNPELPVTSTSLAFIDAGSLNDDVPTSSGSSNSYRQSSASIAGTNFATEPRFQSHRWGKNGASGFGYTITGLNVTFPYRVELGFAEIWTPNCVTGIRRFDVAIQGNVVLSDFDVFDRVGCLAAAIESFDIFSSPTGSIEVEFLKGRNGNPMVSSIEVLPSELDFSVPTSSPTAMPVAQAMSSAPTSTPSATPTTTPTIRPTAVPSSTPTTMPTAAPSAAPTTMPVATGEPMTRAPTTSSTGVPTSVPTMSLATNITGVPTSVPTTPQNETRVPTTNSTGVPTSVPTISSTTNITGVPTSVPTTPPTGPLQNETKLPTNNSTGVPTSVPTTSPSGPPQNETRIPTNNSTGIPTSATRFPTTSPTEMANTTSTGPSPNATMFPTASPTGMPTNVSNSTSGGPRPNATMFPTASPTGMSTPEETNSTSEGPPPNATILPTASPTGMPTPVSNTTFGGPPTNATMFPTASPTSEDSNSTSGGPPPNATIFPTASPTGMPTPVFNATFGGPRTNATMFPTTSPTGVPTPVSNATLGGSPPNATIPTPSPTGMPTPEDSNSTVAGPPSNATAFPTTSPTGMPTSDSNRTFPGQLPNATMLPTASPTGMPTPEGSNSTVAGPLPKTTMFPTASPTVTLVPTPAPNEDFVIETSIPTIEPSTEPPNEDNDFLTSLAPSAVPSEEGTELVDRQRSLLADEGHEGLSEDFEFDFLRPTEEAVLQSAEEGNVMTLETS